MLILYKPTLPTEQVEFVPIRDERVISSKEHFFIFRYLKSERVKNLHKYSIPASKITEQSCQLISIFLQTDTRMSLDKSSLPSV